MIKTERLLLRRVAAGDREHLKRIWDDQKHSVYACFDRPVDTDPDAVRRRTEKWASCADSTDHLFFAVCLDGIPIGYAAFHRRDGGYELGYCFHSAYHGKGYARESISALIGIIRNMQPGAVIMAGTAIMNLPSVRLLQALGFRQTGTERVSFYRDPDGQPICFDGGIFELN